MFRAPQSLTDFSARLTMISKANKNHLKEIYDISLVCLQDFMSFPALEETFENPSVTFMIYKKQEKILGYICFSEVLGEGEILYIAVLPEHRREGIGKALADAVKLSPLFLEVRQSNENAIRFYTSLGFREVSTRKNYYHNPTEDAIVMVKE